MIILIMIIVFTSISINIGVSVLLLIPIEPLDVIVSVLVQLADATIDELWNAIVRALQDSLLHRVGQ